MVKILTKNAVFNLALSCGAIWRRREKPQYRCTTTVPQLHKSPKYILENLLPLVRTNLFVPSHFWTTCTKFDTCYQRYSDVRAEEIWYRCTPGFQSLKDCDGFKKKSFSYLYEVVRTNFFADFWSFRNFRPQLRENCGATWRRKCELYSASERAIPSEKMLKTALKSTHKRRRNAFQTMHPSNTQRSGFGAWQKKTHFRTYSRAGRRSLFDLFQTLHGGRARRVHPKRWQPFFDPIHCFPLGAKCWFLASE